MSWIDDLEARTAQRKADGLDDNITTTFCVTDRNGSVKAQGDTWEEVEWAFDDPTSPWHPRGEPLTLHPAFKRP